MPDPIYPLSPTRLTFPLLLDLYSPRWTWTASPEETSNALSLSGISQGRSYPSRPYPPHASFLTWNAAFISSAFSPQPSDCLAHPGCPWLCDWPSVNRWTVMSPDVRRPVLTGSKEGECEEYSGSTGLAVRWEEGRASFFCSWIE